MNTHYSILFASLRKVTQEKVSIGLLLFNGDTVLFKFSHAKIKALKQLTSKDEYKVVAESVAALEKTLRIKSNYHASNQLFEIADLEFSVDYINYLSRYKNNLITYSQPKPINIEVNNTNILKLFDNLIGIPVEPTMVVKASPFDRLREQYDQQIQRHFTQNRVIAMDEIPNLLVPVKVDLAGRNRIDVFVQSIDMTLNQPQIIQEISTFYLLKETYKKNNQEMYDFVLSEEPPLSLTKQHSLWKHLVNSSEFNYVDISEGNKILQYAEQHNVKPTFGTDDIAENFPF